LVEEDNRREDDWFRRNEEKLIEAARLAREKRERERAEKEAAEALAKLKELHFMKCPKCGHDLREDDLSGIKVDVCSFCEGVFFDAGELEEVFMKRDEERKGLLGKLLRL
jgi:acetyl-CoA carboxylase beta subunit